MAQVLDSLQRILMDEEQYHPSPDDLRLIDVKPDVHVVRVFHRSGLTQRPDGRLCIEAARRLNPEFPGRLDWPAWEIGRKCCHDNAPDCSECPIDCVCPKIAIQRNLQSTRCERSKPTTTLTHNTQSHALTFRDVTSYSE